MLIVMRMTEEQSFTNHFIALWQEKVCTIKVPLKSHFRIHGRSIKKSSLDKIIQNPIYVMYHVSSPP